MKPRYIVTAIAMLVVLALAASSTPAMADSCICDVSTSGAGSFGTNGTVEGTVYVGGGDMEEGDPWNPYMEFDVPAGNVTWARVYWHIWGGTPSGCGWTNATFCNGSQCFKDNQSIPALEDEENNCNHTEYNGFYMGGCGTHWVYWNVTNNVTAGAKNNLTVVNGHVDWDGRVMWMILVVVLENKDYPYTDYWINQGYEDLAVGHKSTTWFNGTINNSVNSTLTHLALCSNGELSILFNDHLVNNYPYGTVEEPTVEDINKSWVENDNTQNMTWDNIGDDWLHPVMAILIDNKTTFPDLTVTDIEIPTVMRPNKNHTINATIENQGEGNATNWFNVTLYVDNVENGTVNVTEGLNAGSSKDVNFTVNLSEGCYTFKVVADSGGDIGEADETNNATSKKNQVGYVIVVKSDSDFDKLVDESKNGTFGDGNVTKLDNTYYIRNFSSITNCVGNGITIENTNAKFVINNCTIHNCKLSGVFFHNLSNGTVNGSEVRNNSKYGIESGLVPLSDEDPKLVNITNSTILENKLCGIELIGRDFIVYNNTVRNNSQQGIYLFANDSKLYNNTIKYNDDYGLKLYNSTGNYVYENKFTENNLDYTDRTSQGWANWTNSWNKTTGNWWSDWKDNSGFPCNYTIDGGDAVDKRPKGLYDFLTGEGTDKWAYRYQVDDKPPGLTDNTVPDTVFTTAQHTNISVDDQTFQNDTADTNYYAAHRFNFSISEDRLSVKKINVTWNGIGTRFHNNGATLYIWNFVSDPAKYDELADSGNTNAEVTLTKEKTGTCCSDYIDSSSGNMTVLVVQNDDSGHSDSQKSTIKTDYVRVAVVATQ